MPLAKAYTVIDAMIACVRTATPFPIACYVGSVICWPGMGAAAVLAWHVESEDEADAVPVVPPAVLLTSRSPIAVGAAGTTGLLPPRQA